MTKREAIQELKRCFDWVPDGKRTMERILETFEADSADLTVLREKTETKEWEAVKVLSGMRIALPDWVCKRLGLQIGNYIRLRWDNDAIWLEPVEFIIKSDALQSHDGESK